MSHRLLLWVQCDGSLRQALLSHRWQVSGVSFDSLIVLPHMSYSNAGADGRKQQGDAHRFQLELRLGAGDFLRLPASGAMKNSHFLCGLRDEHIFIERRDAGVSKKLFSLIYPFGVGRKDLDDEFGIPDEALVRVPFVASNDGVWILVAFVVPQIEVQSNIADVNLAWLAFKKRAEIQQEVLRDLVMVARLACHRIDQAAQIFMANVTPLFRGQIFLDGHMIASSCRLHTLTLVESE